MAEKETRNKPKDMIEAVPEEVEKLDKDPVIQEIIADPKEVEKKLVELDSQEDKKDEISKWSPKTKVGKLVKEGKIKDIDKILTDNKKILEPEIVDKLLIIETDFLSIGQAKGKFGGGKRRAWRQTQKKTQEGNVLSFSTMVVVGDKNGHVGLGYGKAKGTLPAKTKSLRHAKLNIIKIKRGFEDPYESRSEEPHTVPYKVTGKCASSVITLIPAPRGTGLAVADECKKILRLAGIKDVYGVTKGKTRTTFNLAKACMKALEKTTEMVE